MSNCNTIYIQRGNRRHTMNVSAPPKPATASARANRYIPSKPPPSTSPTNKNKRPPPKAKGPTTKNTSNLAQQMQAANAKKRNSPPKPKRNSAKFKATPLALATPSAASYHSTTNNSSALLNTGASSLNDGDSPLIAKSNTIAFGGSNTRPPMKTKRSSLQHTTLSQVMGKPAPKPKPTNNKSRKSKSPPPVSMRSNNNNNNNDENVSRWGNHPHAKLYQTTSNSNSEEDDDSKDNKSRPPPVPPSARHGRGAIHNDNARKPWNDDDTFDNSRKPKRKGKINKADRDAVIRRYSKNIAGFGDLTLREIDKCNIEALLACMHEGSECLKHFHTALTTFSKQQQTQCANFLKLFKKSKSRYAQMDTMPNFFYAISLIHSLLEETVKQSAEFAKFIQISCLPMIQELDLQCDQKYKEIYNATKQQDKKLQESKMDVEKMRKSSKNAAEKVIIARQRQEVQEQNEKLKKKNPNHDKKNLLANVGDMIKAHQHHENSVNDAYLYAKEIEKKFKMSVSDYNQRRMDFIKMRNSGKHEIVNMEHFRVDSMLSVFQKIVHQQQKNFPSSDKDKDKNKVYILGKDIVTHTETMTAKSVVSKFVHLNLETHGEWKVPQAIESTLDVEYRDMFHSVEDAMSITLEINPHVKIPLIVPLLCERIRDLNGFKTEGLFRKSPDKTQMMRIKKRLQVKNFQLTEDNPHVYAAILKDWLRGLEDLIIPKRYYDYCVSMAKENKLNKKQFEVFFSQLPSVNRECLKYLINFLRDFLKPQYQQFTKMGLENIAIVFGPTLLMPPNELEPQVALLNAKSEKQFVVSLIENS